VIVHQPWSSSQSRERPLWTRPAGRKMLRAA
jgi:hypothetical protein